jgi:hypothetical protein
LDEDTQQMLSAITRYRFSCFCRHALDTREIPRQFAVLGYASNGLAAGQGFATIAI